MRIRNRLSLNSRVSMHCSWRMPRRQQLGIGLRLWRLGLIWICVFDPTLVFKHLKHFESKFSMEISTFETQTAKFGHWRCEFSTWNLQGTAKDAQSSLVEHLVAFQTGSTREVCGMRKKVKDAPVSTMPQLKDLLLMLSVTHKLSRASKTVT